MPKSFLNGQEISAAVDLEIDSARKMWLRSAHFFHHWAWDVFPMQPKTSQRSLDFMWLSFDPDSMKRSHPFCCWPPLTWTFTCSCALAQGYTDEVQRRRNELEFCCRDLEHQPVWTNLVWYVRLDGLQNHASIHEVSATGAHFKTWASKFLAGLVTATFFLYFVLFYTAWIILPSVRTERQLKRQTSRTSLPSHEGMKGYEGYKGYEWVLYGYEYGMSQRGVHVFRNLKPIRYPARQKMAEDFARLKAWRAQSGTEGRCCGDGGAENCCGSL